MIFELTLTNLALLIAYTVVVARITFWFANRPERQRRLAEERQIRLKNRAKRAANELKQEINQIAFKPLLADGNIKGIVELAEEHRNLSKKLSEEIITMAFTRNHIKEGIKLMRLLNVKSMTIYFSTLIQAVEFCEITKEEPGIFTEQTCGQGDDRCKVVLV